MPDAYSGHFMLDIRMIQLIPERKNKKREWNNINKPVRLIKHEEQEKYEKIVERELKKYNSKDI